MKIRSRLLFLYGSMIIVLISVNAFSIWAVISWGTAAEKLTVIHSQNIKSEMLRATIYREIGFASDYLLGDLSAETEFQDAQNSAMQLLNELKFNVDEEIENDHIEGLEETQFELVWIVNGLINHISEQSSQVDIESAIERLREIGDEVTDDVAALNQYYNSLENKRLAAETKAGHLIKNIIILAVILALIQFAILALLLQKWLIRPIAIMNNATTEISNGNLDMKIKLTGNDEWTQLSREVNEMVLALKKSRQKLLNQERLAAIGEIAAYSAHNIRNPLAGIRAAIQVMKNEAQTENTEARESFQEIIETIDRLDTWLAHLLAYAKPLELSLSKVDINQLVKQSALIASGPYKNHGIELRWNFALDLPPVEVDSILVEQALTAIATNSFQAVGNNGVVGFKTFLDSDNNSPRLGVQITDNGGGVPEDLEPRLFRIFVSSKENGTGLGLAQAKKIVDAHRGEIKLNSTTGIGTEVIVYFPITNME